MLRSVVSFAAVAALAAAASGCAIQHSGDALMPSSPSAAGGSYLGTWKSSTVSAPTGATCGNFEWRVTNELDGIISGVFTAQCGGQLAVSGSAWAQPSGSTVPITATAGATGPGVLVCDVSFTSTAVADGDTIRVPYSGKTCLGPISGTETLRRQ